MDPLTHAASGAVAVLALPIKPRSAWLAPLAALVCAAPDLDLFFCKTPLDFLLLHRGISHSLAGAPVFGLLLALCCWPLWQKGKPGSWKFIQVWLLCIALILLHIWLDVVTTYGTMIFLPFSHYRVRLNSIFMIDLLVCLPLYWAVLRWRKRQLLLALTLGWIFLYPAAAIGINAWHTAQWQAKLAEDKVSRLHVLPDMFAPFFWRVIYEADTQAEPVVEDVSINALGQERAQKAALPAAPDQLVKRLMAVSTIGDVFFHFAMLPVMDDLPRKFWPDNADNLPQARFMRFYDLRFGSGLEFVQKLLSMRPDADLPFLFMLELSPQGPHDDLLTNMQPERVRLRFSDSGRDSHWHYPVPESKPTFWEWLVGLR